MTLSNPTSNRNAFLRLERICKSFGGFAALKQISFGLQKGEFLTMLGPSGSGKTTTLRTIAGFIQPDSGSIYVDGRDIGQMHPSRRNIGMVFQDYALFPHMSVAANIGYPLEARGISSKERTRRVGEMLEIVGLSQFGTRLPKQISGGQQQRVALARALVFNPDIVLLDEPLGALDKQLRASMQLEITKLVKGFGATVISVTHDQEEALVMSDRIALFRAGELEQIGTPREIYEHPQNEFVADFIGESNILRGEIRDRGAVVGGPFWSAGMPADRPRDFGAKVSLLLRPERITVNTLALNGEGGGLNSATGTIEEVVYLGSEQRVIVGLPDGQRLTAKTRDTSNRDQLAPGRSVTLTWDASAPTLLRT